jgi:RimJ/RimL family protein N-acetyltransferase
MYGMDANIVFRSTRLNGRAPRLGDRALYILLFGTIPGEARLTADLQDWDRYQVSPWVLFHADHPVGVAGFRIGFGDEGLELSFHFLPEVAGQGLASEFVQAALDHATTVLLEDRFFACVEPDNLASIRVLEKAGFVADPSARGHAQMRLGLKPRLAANRADQDG